MSARGLLLVVAVTSLLSHACAAPQILSLPEHHTVQQGAAVMLKCIVDDVGDRRVIWRYVSHDFVISEDDTILVNDNTKYSIPSSPPMYNLQILYLGPSDQGFYECSVEGTDQSVISRVEIVGVPHISLPTQALNKTECCLAHGISDTCLPACVPDDIDLDTFNASTNCAQLTDLTTLSKCFTDGSNHDSCCLYNSVDRLCLSFCHGGLDVTTLTFDHLNVCFNDNTISAIFDCFAVGYESVPGPPTQVKVQALTVAESSLLRVSWEEPRKNADSVTGYILQYKARDQPRYTTSLAKKEERQKLLSERLTPNMLYKVKVLAKSDFGVSFSSVEVDVFVPDSLMADRQNVSIRECCHHRDVHPSCQEKLCQARIWSEFHTADMLDCVPDLDNVFSCLTGEQNHTECCAAFDVSADCLPMCSGRRPSFDSSLIGCVTQLSVIEACVQQGYDSLPAPPTNLELDYVDTHVAVISFEPTRWVQEPGALRYVVQLRTGRTGGFVDVGHLAQEETLVRLDSQLQPNTFYQVRIVAEVAGSGSLPSETVAFLTYPDDSDLPDPDPVVNVPNNMTECCQDRGMPEICWRGCQYRPDMTAYYSDKLDSCYAHIGTVLTCASDGRDHSECCRASGMNLPELCVDLCRRTTVGPLEKQYHDCVPDTPKAVMCYIEGIVTLPRHPDLVVTNVSRSTISLAWTQPETSGLIDLYRLDYAEMGGAAGNLTTAETVAILQDLKSGTEYHITVTASNENGTSVPSPVLRVYTLPGDIEIPDIDQIPPSGRALWENITHCCENAGLSRECVPECVSQQTASSSHPACRRDRPKILGCFADGQDHAVCCESSGLPAECLPLCRGHPMGSNLLVATCLSYKHEGIILSCLLESSGLIPLPPQDFKVVLLNTDVVQLSWEESDFCHQADCFYTVHFWREGQHDSATDQERVSSPYNITSLEESQSYTFTVAASNTYGTSAPAPWTTLYNTAFNRQVAVRLVSNEEWVERGNTATLECSTFDFNPSDPPRISWMFNNRHMENQRRKTLVVPAVDPRTHEGTYTCTAQDSFTQTSSSFFLPIKYAPVIDRLPVQTAAVGGDAKVACWFNGYPDSPAERWMKDGQSIPMDRTRFNPARDARYHTGITSYRLKIYNVQQTDYGHYSLNVSNSYGSTTCHAMLKDPAEIIDLKPAPKQADPEKCCAESGVSQLCQRLCSLHVDIAQVINDIQYLPCLASFDIMLKCGADGRDHSKCCRGQAVLPFCLPFCEGVSPASVLNDTDKLLQCVHESSSIFACVQEGHKNIPYPPRSVSTRRGPGSRSFTVTWSPPEFNFDLVDHYTVFYRRGERETPKTITVNHHLLTATIDQYDQRSVYHVWVTAGNKNGRSQPSDVVTFPPAGAVPVAPTNLSVSLAEGSSDVVISWEAGTTGPSGPAQPSIYNIYYKEVNQVKFTPVYNIPGTSHRLTGLKPSTEYTAYVTAVSAGGTESQQSEDLHFTTGLGGSPSTGGQGADDSSDKVAIGVGVAVAIVAVAAIVMLVLFFVFRSRVSSPKSSTSVEYENPGYGQGGGGVKFGRLEEEGGYDNLASTAVQEGTSGHTGQYLASTSEHTYDNHTNSQQQTTAAVATAATLEVTDS